MKPVLKWVGGKRQLIKDIKKLAPEAFETYYEPFIGGGAVLFALRPNKAVINDLNKELFNIYRVIKENSSLEKLMKKLDEHEKNHNEAYYYQIRSLDRSDDFHQLTKEEKAARTIYLNKTGFNGLYRVNSKGYYNVPSGKKINVNTYEKDNLLEINQYFKDIDITILNEDFYNVTKTAQENDFVYFDPPYDKIKDDTFTSYDKSNFTREDQKRLFDVFEELSQKGVYVMLSNHNTDFIRELYKSYNIHIVYANRMVNSNGSKRGKIEEVIITNYEV